MPDNWTLTRFFTPLAIQAASQALSYPLVAMVASRGPGGPLNLAGLAQANTVMFFFGMIAISSVTTGMVYAKTREGYQRFRKVTLLTGLGVAAIQASLCIPALSHLLFGRLIGLPPSIEQPAYTTFVISIPLQFLFFLRIPYFVVMYLGKATGKASLATIGRIILTALLSLFFCNPPGAKEIFNFNLPLSVGGYFLSASAIILAAFIARAPDPDRILPVYYLALGLANPVAFAATRLQTIVLAFPPQSGRDNRTFRFCLTAGAVLSILPLIFILPGLAEFYFIRLQKLGAQDLALVRMTVMSLIFFPFSVAIRAQTEGLAAWLKKPITVLAGHALFMGTIIATGFALLFLGIPGQLIGPVGLTLGSLASSATMRIVLDRGKTSAIPVGQTTTSIGQVR